MKKRPQCSMWSLLYELSNDWTNLILNAHPSRNMQHCCNCCLFQPLFLPLNFPYSLILELFLFSPYFILIIIDNVPRAESRTYDMIMIISCAMRCIGHSQLASNNFLMNWPNYELHPMNYEMLTRNKSVKSISLFTSGHKSYTVHSTHLSR